MDKGSLHFWDSVFVQYDFNNDIDIMCAEIFKQIQYLLGRCLVLNLFCIKSNKTIKSLKTKMSWKR